MKNAILGYAFFDAPIALVGVLAVVLGRFLPERVFIPFGEKWLVIDKKKYLAGMRGLFLLTGLVYAGYGLLDFALRAVFSCNILQGFALRQILLLLVPVLIFIFGSRELKSKYIRHLGP